MKQCEKCIHEKVCQHKANIQTDTYAYMSVKYDTENCQYYMPDAQINEQNIEESFSKTIERICERHFKTVEKLKKRCFKRYFCEN